MDILTIDRMMELINKKGLFISIYLPTFSSGVDIRQNPIRFKQLLRDAEAELYDMQMTKGEVETFLKPAKDLIVETRFWQNQSDGLALFIHEDSMEYFRLPIEFKESVTIGKKLYIKPLLPLFSGNGQFNVLAISKNQVRLFRCTRQISKEIELIDAPDSVHDMQVDDDPKTKLDMRLSSPVKGTSQSFNKNTQAQGNENEYEKNELTRYFRAVDEALNSMHKGEIIPLVLAGVEYLTPIYREKSNYPYIVEEFIKGNPELLNGDELRNKAWEIVEPIFVEEQITAKDKYNQFYGQRNKLFANSLERIIPAAFSGQVESLFLNNEIESWGKFHHEDNKLEIHEEKNEGDEDLMEYVSILTLSRGGKVFSVEPEKIPSGNSVAAVLRY